MSSNTVQCAPMPGWIPYAPGTGHALPNPPELEQSGKVPVIRQPRAPSRPFARVRNLFFLENYVSLAGERQLLLSLIPQAPPRSFSDFGSTL
jgi:hypothetical protein